MTPLKRSTSKRDKARKAVQSRAKSVKRTAKRKGAATLVKKLVPTRVLVVLGGAGAALVAAVTLKKRKAGSRTQGPSYAAPTGPPAAGS